MNSINYKTIIPLGPVDQSIIVDNFTYKQVKNKKCSASICNNICDNLIQTSNVYIKYLCICVPCYNEDLKELTKTLMSIMENVEFMQRKVTKFNIYIRK
jgi:hypothetical protein